ncbi:nucleoside deaminase [Agromyces sp. NPDC056523]|uniref:nucleoside deaminase n=1 Tax=Agromyces sp. NPDC056523 TaxID=3345850 RepID=UPI00366F9B61
MGESIRLAALARERGELPYGAVVLTPEGAVVGRGHDQVEADSDLTSHAEILAVRDAVRRHGRSLDGCTLVSTVEPCAMCFSAAWTAGVSRLVFGLSMAELLVIDPASMDEISIDAVELNHRTRRRLEIRTGVLRSECLALWAQRER